MVTFAVFFSDPLVIGFFAIIGGALVVRKVFFKNAKTDDE